MTCNPCPDELFARSPNELIELVATTQDVHILKRRWLFIDINSGAASQISSADAERDAALSLAEDIRYELGRDGWPEPLRGMSDNGAYLLDRINLPNDAETKALYERTLKCLDERFSIEGSAHIDTSTANAGRIAKVLGTWARGHVGTQGIRSSQWFSGGRTADLGAAAAVVVVVPRISTVVITIGRVVSPRQPHEALRMM